MSVLMSSSSPSSSNSNIFCFVSRRPYDENDDFFVEGNIERYSKLKLIAQVQGEEEDAVEPLDWGLNSIECTHQGCGALFSSIVAYTAHYKSHACQCSTCSNTYPNLRLLDIHQEETHSSYFSAQSRRNPCYVCLVEGCSDVFWTAELRDWHLQAVHGMRASLKMSTLRATVNNQKNKLLDEKQTSARKYSSKEEIDKERQERKQKKLKQRFACRFVLTSEGCRYGDRCKFFHPDNNEDSAMRCEDNETEDESVVSLLEGFQQVTLQNGHGSLDRSTASGRKMRVHI